MTEVLWVNGELTRSRKETHGKQQQTKSVPVFTSRMEKREYYRSVQFDIRNVVDVTGFLKDIRRNWNTYVTQVHQWLQNSAIKKLIVTGIFTVVLGLSSTVANAAYIQEYTYQVKSGEKIETIAAAHGVTAQEILEANGLTSINGKKILLPKVEDRTVTATSLNVRSQPNTASSVIGSYKKGDVVKVAFIENGWAGILIKGRVCFVSAEYLLQKQAVESQANTMIVTASSLRVRELASTSSTVLGSLKLDDRVSVTSISNGWAKIQFNGKAAYVSAAYLTNNKPVNTQNESTNNSSGAVSTSVYVIKSGDTFTKISKALGVSVSSIQALNPTVEPTKLKIGQKINIPVGTASTPNQISVVAQIAGIEPNGNFRFITADGSTYAAKASGNMINKLFAHQGKTVTLTLEGKRGQHMTLISLQ
ncbi:LysM peptidoglycan-binding domain-containing protein [Bacillus sp. S3]|uniref:LysM peptidoglycan-binding domain-containing protein n=1 Tax=Bacillus sp. S3 TaxID=486398 RepID=UPI00118BE904|nr:SH3 domain-containing protein [Bacillus sp. S3]QCJ44475.1 LysM peptidoglycan-binding domain-containing protein [Bacillus sp. S3]